MNYEERVVCFIDFLGFRDIIAETVDGDDDVPERIENLSQALDLMKYLVDRSGKGIESSHRVTQFSDDLLPELDFHQPNGSRNSNSWWSFPGENRPHGSACLWTGHERSIST
jgi:hypothetical protein